VLAGFGTGQLQAKPFSELLQELHVPFIRSDVCQEQINRSVLNALKQMC
jgi:hypothetical protein